MINFDYLVRNSESIKGFHNIFDYKPNLMKVHFSVSKDTYKDGTKKSALIFPIYRVIGNYAFICIAAFIGNPSPLLDDKCKYQLVANEISIGSKYIVKKGEYIDEDAIRARTKEWADELSNNNIVAIIHDGFMKI